MKKTTLKQEIHMYIFIKKTKQKEKNSTNKKQEKKNNNNKESCVSWHIHTFNAS